MTPALSEFPHHHAPVRADNRNRIAAGVSAGVAYALIALLVWWSLSGMPVPVETAAITATLVPDSLKKQLVEPPRLALAQAPRLEKPAPPTFTIARGAPPMAPVPLPATTTQPSTMPGGTAGNGTLGQAGGGNGNGNGAGGCLDPVWMRAVTDRVRQFFYYPGAALAVHRTGVVMMHFVVGRDGRLERLEIGKSSGDAGLDQAATDILQKAQPLPPIPDRMHADRVEGELPINFGVRSFNGSTTAGHC